MKILLLLGLLSLVVLADELSYETLNKKIIRELNYIYQMKTWTGGSTFKEGRKFTYYFKALSAYELEITQKMDGICLNEPFIIDLRDEYYVELEANNKCDPALIISHELDIIYLYVKDRCGHFGGFNLYKRASTSAPLLKEYFYKAAKKD